MDLTIHAYGYAETIFNTLNALAMIRNSNLWPAMITTISLMVGTYYAWKIAGSGMSGEWRGYLMRVFGMVFLVNALLMPRTTMYVRDHVEKHFWKVDNIPLAFALPVGMVEQLGHLITMSFEQAFNVVGGKSSFNYYHYGSAFGARLGKEVMEAKVRDPEFISNMHNFMKRCVILPAMIGHQFTKEELVATNNIWGLVSQKAGTFARTDMTINGVRQRPAPTCKQAIPYFEKMMEESVGWNVTSLSAKFQAAGSSKEYNQGYRQLNTNLKQQIAALYGDNTNVHAVLKHNMMINALNDYRAGKFPAARAKMQHEAGGLISGDLAEHILTGLLAVMKNLVYGSFVFVVPLMLMSGGMAKYRMWITFCLSLQLWPAMLAMLNMLIDYAYEPAKIVSYSSWSTELNKFDSMASIAANLTLVIPFLAIWVTRMGENGFTHLAGNIMASAGGGVAAAASEKSTGLRSWDNESIGNVSRNNENSNKVNTSMEYVSGGNGFMHADGSMERVTSGGNVVRTGGAGSTASSGETSYGENVGLSSVANTSVRNEQSAVTSETVALSKAQEVVETFEEGATYTIAENTRTDNGYNIDTSTETGKELVKGFNEIDRINKTNDYGWQQNAKAYARANTSFGKSLKEFFGFGASIEVGGDVEAINNSTQSDGQSQEIGKETNAHDRSSTSERRSKTDAYLESLGIDKTQLQSARAAHNESQRLEQSIAAHKEEIKAWNEVKELNETSGAESRKELFPEVVQELQNRHGYDRSQAWQAASQRTPEAQEAFMRISTPKAIAMKEQIGRSKQDIESSTAMNDINAGANINKDPTNSSVVKQFKDDHHMASSRDVENTINNVGNNLKSGFEQNYDENADKYSQKSILLNSQYTAAENYLEVLEQNRMGNGKFARGIGNVVDFVSAGNAGSNIGRPPEDKPMPEFEPIMKYYGEDKMISSLDESRISTPPRESEFDASAAQNMMNDFAGSDDDAKTNRQYVVSNNNKKED